MIKNPFLSDITPNQTANGGKNLHKPVVSHTGNMI